MAITEDKIISKLNSQAVEVEGLENIPEGNITEMNLVDFYNSRSDKILLNLPNGDKKAKIIKSVDQKYFYKKYNGEWLRCRAIQQNDGFEQKVTKWCNDAKNYMQGEVTSLNQRINIIEIKLKDMDIAFKEGLKALEILIERKKRNKENK